MKLRYYEAFSVPDCIFSMMSKEMFESYKSFFKSHLDFLKDFAPKESLKRRGIRHFVFALNDDENKVVGIRYFYFSLDLSECELFYVYVEEDARRNGVASRLIDLSVSIAKSYGIDQFHVKITASKAEGEGLIRVYESLAFAYSPCNFTISFDAKILNIPTKKTQEIIHELLG